MMTFVRFVNLHAFPYVEPAVQHHHRPPYLFFPRASWASTDEYRVLVMDPLHEELPKQPRRCAPHMPLLFTALRAKSHALVS